MDYKFSFTFLLMFAYVAGSFWVYNHINAWIGIALILGLIIFLLDKFKLK